VECRRCEVHCDKVVYPGCVRRAGVRVRLRYEAFGHTYMGCMQRVFDVEIDLDLLRAAERRRDGFGAVVARKGAAADVPRRGRPCYEQRADDVGCRNPEFYEMPVASPSFRVFARLSD